MNVISVYAVFADAEEAERIGRAMVEERLAACVNILGPVRSIYRWKGGIETGDEVAAIFKTTRARRPAYRPHRRAAQLRRALRRRLADRQDSAPAMPNGSRTASVSDRLAPLRFPQRERNLVELARRSSIVASSASLARISAPRAPISSAVCSRK